METTIINHKSKFLELAAKVDSALNHALPEWVQQAKEALETLDMPTTRHEEWKYTRTTKLQNEIFEFQKPVTSEINYHPFDAFRLVFVNGYFQPQLSDSINEEGLEIKLNENIQQEDLKAFELNKPAHFFEAFQRSSSSAAMCIKASSKYSGSKPLHIIHVTDTAQCLATPSIFIQLEKSAALEINESFISSAENISSLTIRHLQVSIAANARLEYNKLQDENDHSFQICLEDIVLADDGYSNFNTLTLNGGWVRNDLRIALDGKNIESHLSGFYLPRNKQLIDNHTKVDHRQPHCVSNELYKGILFDHSTGVFNGKVYVRKDAQKTNAYQNNANILAGDHAVMNTKPELEIYADDVKCSHGTTTGQLDESAMWYLRSRGIGENAARRLLTSAFINDVIQKINNPEVSQYVIDDLTKKNLLYV